MIKQSMLSIRVSNIKKTTAFYQQVLGFRIIKIGEVDRCILQKDACCIMVTQSSLTMAEKPSVGLDDYFCYLIVEAIQTLYKKIQACGVEIVKEMIDEQSGMREFCIKTVDGHTIMIGEKISPLMLNKVI